MDDALIELLTGFAVQNKNALVPYADFLQYAEKYAYDNNLTELIRKLRDQKIEIVPTLMQWEYKGAGTLFRKEGAVDSILVHAVLKNLIAAAYEDIEQSPEFPFPTDADFPFTIPERLIMSIDVAKEFIDFLGEIDTVKTPLVKMVFPEGVKSLITAKDVVKTRLIECCLHKLGRYLQFKMNVSYMNNRLEAVLSGNLEAVRNMINDVIAKPKKVLQLFYDGDDFSSRFFSQFTAVIIKDYRDKKTKHVDEHGFLQSAYVLGYFAGYQKSVVQRRQQREMEQAQLEKLIRRPPYAFTAFDLYNLRDNRGMRYSEKYDRDFIQDFIRRMTTSTDRLKLPSLLSVRLGGDKDVFIHKDYLIPLFLNALKEASAQIYREYVDEWQTLLKNNTRLPSMKYDREFAAELEYKVKERYPLLNALRDPRILSLTAEERDPSDAQVTALSLCFSGKKTLKPINELLELRRDKIIATVKTLLPSWYTTPILKQIFFFFKWLLGRGNRGFKQQALRLWREVKNEDKAEAKNEEKGGAGREYTDLIAARKTEVDTREAARQSREAAAKMRKQLDSLRSVVIGRDVDLDNLLETLREKWNPLFDPAAKANLVEDVNCFVRDYLRRAKKTFRVRPPSAVQVRDMAHLLSENKNLQAIKKKETLRAYIEAYIIQVLEEQYHIR
ncbi:MAG: hypothetical protein JXD23_15775 [Spirochaetales bacterium]|nr:hypothetical protein [Spirochaetales bacterium]